jgi:hypothetical protein
LYFLDFLKQVRKRRSKSGYDKYNELINLREHVKKYAYQFRTNHVRHRLHVLDSPYHISWVNLDVVLLCGSQIHYLFLESLCRAHNPF